MVNKIEHEYLKVASLNSYAELTWDKKKTEYVCVTVADSYQFYFDRTGTRLLEIDDVHSGEWITYIGKEVSDWFYFKGRKEFYEKYVIPTLQMFLKKFPAKTGKKTTSKKSQKKTKN